VVENCFHGIRSQLKFRASSMGNDFQHHVFERDFDLKQAVPPLIFKERHNDTFLALKAHGEYV
jgi:hypothetical protein